MIIIIIIIIIIVVVIVVIIIFEYRPWLDWIFRGPQVANHWLFQYLAGVESVDSF
jgi:hypothetical protein